MNPFAEHWFLRELENELDLQVDETIKNHKLNQVRQIRNQLPDPDHPWLEIINYGQ
jgi:hypothetical protein